jgi:hypothetical protein
MGWPTSIHSEPARKLGLFQRRLVRLRGAVKHCESSIHISKAAEDLRLAGSAIIKAKRSLVQEYPQNDPDGRISLNLQAAEQLWLELSTLAIIEEHGHSDP